MNNRNSKSQRSTALTVDDTDEEPCAGACTGLPTRKSLNLTVGEEVCLETLRHVLSMYMTADANHWNAAVEFAETNLGHCVSVPLVVQVTNLVRALRVERSVPFNFLTFGCHHITSDELSVISALQTFDYGQEHDRNDALQYLAQSAVYPKLKQAVLALSQLLATSREHQNLLRDAFGAVRDTVSNNLH